MSVLNHPCVKCGAPRGNYCRSSGGNILAEAHSHIDRFDLTGEPPPETSAKFLRLHAAGKSTDRERGRGGGGGSAVRVDSDQHLQRQHQDQPQGDQPLAGHDRPSNPNRSERQ